MWPRNESDLTIFKAKLLKISIYFTSNSITNHVITQSKFSYEEDCKFQFYMSEISIYILYNIS